MQAISTQKFVRMSPTKIRPVAREVLNLTPMYALQILPLSKKRAAQPLQKVIKTAVANAKQKGASVDDLVFKEIQIGEGPRLKRGRAVSKGRWHPYKRRMSHIRVVLETRKKQVSDTKSQTKTKSKNDKPKSKTETISTKKVSKSKK